MKHERKFMEAAIEESIKARESGDYGVGAVIVRDGKIIAAEGNRAILDKDSTQHAEVAAIRRASKLLDSRFLEGCVLYTTHEPCPMCASAAIWARMEGIVFGATIEDMADYRLKHATRERTWRTIDIKASEVIGKGDPKPFLIEGFMRDECKKLFHS
jgi:tRNA(Arg) A34 adenosine deaminase TadA